MGRHNEKSTDKWFSSANLQVDEDGEYETLDFDLREVRCDKNNTPLLYVFRACYDDKDYMIFPFLVKYAVYNELYCDRYWTAAMTNINDKCVECKGRRPVYDGFSILEDGRGFIVDQAVPRSQVKPSDFVDALPSLLCFWDSVGDYRPFHIDPLGAFTQADGTDTYKYEFFLCQSKIKEPFEDAERRRFYKEAYIQIWLEEMTKEGLSPVLEPVNNLTPSDFASDIVQYPFTLYVTLPKV